MDIIADIKTATQDLHTTSSAELVTRASCFVRMKRFGALVRGQSTRRETYIQQESKHKEVTVLSVTASACKWGSIKAECAEPSPTVSTAVMG